MGNFDLIIFDFDGTLAEFKTGVILPGVKEWFAAHVNQRFAIASNQGGVGMRHWMQSGGFGDPSKYPTEKDIDVQVKRVLRNLLILREQVSSIELRFAYKSRAGNWSPAPIGEEHRPEWSWRRRKPAPGMLIDAMRKAGVTPEQTLMVGDWNEDRQAATAAGCAFVEADTFFGRTAPAPDRGEDAVPQESQS